MITEELKIISLALAVLTPFSWGIALIIHGLKKKATKILLFFLLFYASFVFLMTYAKFQNHLHIYTALFPIHVFCIFNLFSAFYLYVRSLTKTGRQLGRRTFAHLITPVFFFVGQGIIHWVLFDKAERYLFIQNVLLSNKLEGLNYEIAYYFYTAGRLTFLVSSIVYFVLTAICYAKHKDRIKNIFASDDKTELNWLRFMIISFILVIIFNVIIHYLKNNYVAEKNLLIAISYSIFSIFFWILGLKGYQQKELFNPVKIEISQAFDNDLKINIKDVVEYLEKEKPYLNPEINVYDFCYYFKTNRTYISSVINKGFDTNFRGLVNSYRITEAKTIINEQLKEGTISIYLENISLKVGFNSYNTFLRVFKSTEGITPKEYVDKKKSQQPGG